MNIYLLNLTSVSEQDVSEYTHILDADRQSRIGQYARSADKRRSFGVGAALLYAWRMQYKDRPMPQTARDENGKPYFVGERISFCLSHSGDYAACVLAENPNSEWGLDIQEPRSVDASAAARFFSAGEQEQIRAGSDPCLIWSRKESFAKYRGTGLRGDLRLLDTAGETLNPQSCRTAGSALNLQSCRVTDGALNLQSCRVTDSVVNPQSCRVTDSALNPQFHRTADDAVNCWLQRTADGAAYLWSCRTLDGYAVSVCTEEDTVFRLVDLTWEQVKGIL